MVRSVGKIGKIGKNKSEEKRTNYNVFFHLAPTGRAGYIATDLIIIQ